MWFFQRLVKNLTTEYLILLEQEVAYIEDCNILGLDGFNPELVERRKLIHFLKILS